MVKEKRILSYFIGWLILGIIICFVGLSNVSASEIIIPGTAQFYDNSGTSLNGIDTRLENTTYYATFTTASNSYGGLVTFQLNTTLQEGRIYSIFLLIGAENYGGTTKPSTKPSIGIGRNYASSNTSYINNTNPSSYSASSGTTGEKTRGIYYTFIANETGSYISVPYTSEYTCSNCSQYFSGYSLEDLGNSENLSQDEVNSIINNQTSIIQNNINNMEQSIVNSNKETQEVIKDQFNDCHDSVNLFKVPNNQTVNGITLTNNSDGTFNLNGTATEDVNFSIYVPIDESGIVNKEIYTLSKASNYNFRVQVAFYNGTTWVRTPLNLAPGSQLYVNNTIDLSNITRLRYIITIVKDTSIKLSNVKIQLEKGSNATSWEPFGEEICSNKIDETNDKLDGIQGALTDSSSPNTGALENSAGWLPAGPLDSILNLPLTMLNSLTNSLGKTCTPLNLKLPYVNKYIQIPCLSAIFAKITGVNGLWTWVGTIASVLILYNYLLNLYAWVDRVLTLRAEFDEAMGADLANWGRL